MSQPALTIGHITLEHPTVLAPMEAITDRSFRAFIRRMGGCGLVVTEFVSSENLTRKVRKAQQMAEVSPDEHPVSIQIYGRSPEKMAEAADICAELGADIVDINMGCPSKAVTGGCSGVALMREPQLAVEIVRAVRQALPTSIPLTVKMRLGWDRGSVNAPDLAHACQEEGAALIAVHGRTRADGYKGRADWDSVGQVKDRLRVPLLVNGDILTVEDAFEALRRARADGVMVGRGTMRNPWLLKQVSQALGGEPVTEPTLSQRRRALLEYYEIIEAQIDSEIGALGKMKKVAGYFTCGIPDGAKVRQAIQRSPTIAEAKEAVHAYFDRLEGLVRSEPQLDPFGERHDEVAA